jgi:hypothetical protein
MKQVFNILILFIIMGFLQNCSVDMAGATSETTNGIVVSGIATSPEGGPVSGAKVFIQTVDFLKDTSEVNVVPVPEAITDNSGMFVIDSVFSGTYYIVINDHGKNAVRFMCDIKPADSDPINLGTIGLLPSAGFYGLIDRSDISIEENVYVQIYGIDRVSLTDTSGEFLFGGLPAGTHIIRAISSNPSHGILEADTITVDPAENRNAGTFLLPFEFWRDTVVVRRILDTNGLVTTPVSEVVSIGKYGRVFDLKLTNRSISILPPTVGELRLRKLLLGSNALDSLPDEIGRILSLKHLILQRNQLVYIPESIGNLTHLEHLDISGNKLTTLPQSIINLTNLIFLTVIHNRLHSVPPPIKIWLDTYSFEKNWQELQDP